MKFVTSALLLFILSGCGGSTNNSNEVEIDLLGIYTGYLDINGASNGFPFVALISSDNQLVIIGNPGGSGEIVQQNGVHQISLSIYQGSIFNYQSQFNNLQLNTIEARVDKERVGADWSNSTATIPASSVTEERVLLRLTKNSIVNSTGLEDLVGNWTSNFSDSNGGLFTQTITIDAQGQIDGSDTNGCIYLGNVTNAATLVFPFNITISSCDTFNGSYGGLMAMTPVGGSNQLYLFASNEENGFSSVLQW